MEESAPGKHAEHNRFEKSAFAYEIGMLLRMLLLLIPSLFILTSVSWPYVTVNWSFTSPDPHFIKDGKYCWQEVFSRESRSRSKWKVQISKHLVLTFSALQQLRISCADKKQKNLI